MKRFKRFFFAALGVSSLASSAFAQSCPMCYEAASQAGAKASRAIDHGILALLLPALLLFAGVLVFAVRRANIPE
jgi:hypothetical protein